MADKELRVNISSNLNATGFTEASKKIGELKTHTDGLSGAFGTFAGLAASLGAITLFKNQINETLQFADSLNKLSQKTGISADELYSLSAAAKLSDVNLEDMSKSLGKFSKSIGENSKTFDTLGLSIKNNDGTLKNSFDLLGELSDKFADMPDGASKATLAMQLFGKSGAAMIPLLNGGRDSLREYLGVMDQDTAKAAERFNDSFTKIHLASDAVYMKFVKELSPTLKILSDDMDLASKKSDGLADSLSKVGSSIAEKTVETGYVLKGVFENYGHLYDSIKNVITGGDFQEEVKTLTNATSITFNSTQAKVKSLNGEIALTMTGLKDIEKTIAKDEKKKDYGLPDDTKVKAYETALIKINDAINKNSFTAYEYGLTLIDKEVAEYQKAGIKKGKIDEYILNAKIELGIKQLEQETKDREAREKEVKAQYNKEQDAMLGYYKAVGMESDAFYLEEVMKLQKLADAGILTNSQMLEIWAKDNEKFQDEQFKKSHAWLYDLFENVNKALDSQFFDTMTGKFHSFGDWIKKFFTSIGTSIAQGLSRSLAGSLTSSLQGGIVNTFKSYGGFGGSASLVGTSLSASDVSSIAGLSGSSVSNGMIKTSGGTLIDQASGTITSQGSDAMSILSMASSAKTIYGALTDGISGSVLSGFNGVASGFDAIGLSGAGNTIGQFGYGFANPYSATTSYGAIGAGSTVSGMAIGGIGGYALGSIGDAIFGAYTKAGSYGAIGGALGSLLGPVGAIGGALLGSILGGFFGSTKQTGAGIDILGNASADSANGQYWQSYKKKSWFSSKSWTNTTGFGEAENQAIMQTIGIYDTLLSQLGTYNDLIVAGGRFSNLQEFLDGNVVKSFLTAINPQNLDEIYKSWTDYAAKIDTTITQALATAVSGYTTYGRGFTEWKLGSGTTEQLKFTAEYLQKDFTALASSLGANGVTVDNFLAKYDEAIKANFTQDTITAWASLGDTLMKSTDATTKYNDALKSLTATTATLPADMMLGKGTDGTKIYQQIANDNTTMKLMYADMLKTMKSILTIQQFGVVA